MGENSESTSESQNDGSSGADSVSETGRDLAGRKADVDALAANAADKGKEVVEKAGGKEGETYDTPSASEISIPSSVNPDGSPNESVQDGADDSSGSDE